MMLADENMRLPNMHGNIILSCITIHNLLGGCSSTTNNFCNANRACNSFVSWSINLRNKIERDVTKSLFTSKQPSPEKSIGKIDPPAFEAWSH